MIISSSGGQIEAAPEAERAAAAALPGAERVQRARAAHDAHLQTAQRQDTQRRQDFNFLSHYLRIWALLKTHINQYLLWFIPGSSHEDSQIIVYFLSL